MILLYISILSLFICAVVILNIPLIQKFQSGFTGTNANKPYQKSKTILIACNKKPVSHSLPGIMRAESINYAGADISIAKGRSSNRYITAPHNSYRANYRSGADNRSGKNNRPGENNNSGESIVPGAFALIEKIILLGNIKEVIIADDSCDYETMFSIVDKCNKNNVNVKINSEKLKILKEKLKAKQNEGISFVCLSGYNNVYIKFGIKRAMDLLIAAIAIIVLTPLMLVISLLIKITSPGPILFGQQRVGLNGKCFRMYKFRSMRKDYGSDENRKKMMLEFMKLNKAEGRDTKIVDTKRITKVGSILRKTSLDELPQLFNVIRGEMSLVGPRPCIPYEYENYYPWQKKRVSVLPGCTGLWQVSGRSSVSFNDSVLLDLYYVNNISFLLDLKLLFRTIPVMIFSQGGR